MQCLLTWANDVQSAAKSIKILLFASELKIEHKKTWTGVS